MAFVVNFAIDKKLKQRLKSAEFLPVTVDGARKSPVPTPRKIKLNRVEDIRLEMAKVYREARGGTMDVSDAGRFTFMLSSMAKLIEATNLEARIEDLERKFLK